MKHEFAYKERWIPPTVGPALVKGQAWHSMMEAHYRAIQSGESVDLEVLWAQAQVAALDWLIKAQLEPELEELLTWMYVGYVEYWEGRDWGVEPRTKVLAVEHAPEVWLRTPAGGRSRFKLKLKIDLVVLVDGKLWIVDHKSGKDLPRDKELDIDDQFGLYTWAMRQMGKPVFGSIHNAARTHRNKDQVKHLQPLEERFARKRLYRTDEELTHLAIDAYRAARMAYSLRPGEAPRAPDPDRCGWRCAYTEPCLAGRKGMDDREMLRDMSFVQDFGRH
jgi:hypothetical protein